MTPQATSGQWRLGLSMALATVFFWATLSVVMKLALRSLDPYTLTWFRFLVAFAVTAAFQLPRHGLRPWRALPRWPALLLVFASFMLVANYVGYITGLALTTPGNAQVLIQLAPVCLTLGGILVFGERYTRAQWAGFLVLVLGLALFSSAKMGGLTDTRYLFGTAVMVVAALTWGAYAMAQKALHRHLSAQQVLLAVYLTGSIVLLPLADPGRILALKGPAALAVAYCSLNTLGAYGAFAESLRHWDASRISAILTITPLGTLATVALAHRFWPALFDPEPMSAVAWAGALLVVVGSAASSLAKASPEAPIATGAEG